MTGPVLACACNATHAHCKSLSLAFLVGNDQDPANPITEVIPALTRIAPATGAPPELNVDTEIQHHSPVNLSSYPLFKFGFNHLSKSKRFQRLLESPTGAYRRNATQVTRDTKDKVVWVH